MSEMFTRVIQLQRNLSHGNVKSLKAKTWQVVRAGLLPFGYKRGLEFDTTTPRCASFMPHPS